MESEENVDQTRETIYTHLVLEGTAYEVGQQLGEYCKNHPNLLEQMTIPFQGNAKIDSNQAEEIHKLLEQYCPELNEELQGFADFTQICPEDLIIYYAYRGKEQFHCSHFAVNPADDNLMVARSYEFCWGEDPLLITTHIKGQPAQMGFASHLFGRIDGMNEYGLCVTTASGNVSYHLKLNGFVFGILVRSILNHCRTVEEAVDFLLDVPNGEGRSYIIADATGRAVLFEAVGDMKSYRYLSEKTNQTLYEANHFTLPKTKDQYSNIAFHSLKCYQAMEAFLQDNQSLNVEKVEAFLGKPIPQGCCCQHYIEGFGTMWSIVFEPIKKVAHICFGSPQYGEWREISLDDKNAVYPVTLVNEVSRPEFWSMAESKVLDHLITSLRKEKEITAIVLDFGYDTEEAWRDEGMHLTVLVSSRKKYQHSYTIDFEGITVYLFVIEREEFLQRQNTEYSAFINGFQGVLLYAKDETFSEYFKRSYSNRAFDRELLLLRTSNDIIRLIKQENQCMKRYENYSKAYEYILRCASSLAEIEVNLHTEVPVRSTMVQASIYHPKFFQSIYTDLIYDQVNEHKITDVMEQIDTYLADHATTLFHPILLYLNEQRRFVGLDELDTKVGQRYQMQTSLFESCEWLSNHHILTRGKESIQLTYGSKNAYEEVAYYYDGGR